MSFELELKKGKLDRKINETYHVHIDHPAYQYLLHSCLSFEVMGIAVSVRKKLNPPNDGHLSLPCKAFKCTVVLPANSVVDFILAQRPDDRPFIEITYEWNSDRSKTEWALGVRKWMELTLASGFVELYERNKRKIHKRDSKVAAAAKVVRDACSHNFKIAISNSEGVELDGMKIKTEDRNKSLWEFVDLGDFFVLAMRMFSEPKT